jgi:signal peptidase I
MVRGLASMMQCGRKLAGLLMFGLVLGLAPLVTPAQAFCFCLKCLSRAYSSYQPIAGSMKPTIEPGACVTVLKGAAVDHGSIIVFRHPVTPETDFIKRLIGLPGDTVEVRHGRLVLNGAEVPQTEAPLYLQPFILEGPSGVLPYCPQSTAVGGTCEILRRTETLPDGSSWDVLDAVAESVSDSFGPVTVPADHVFVLGDHRDNSLDSRFAQDAGGMGFIPVANIIGPVVEIRNP